MTGLPVQSAWFRSQDVGDGITQLVEPHIDTMLESNIWHVRGDERDLVIDTGNGVGRLMPQLERLREDRPVTAVATHGHFDHTGGMVEFDDRRCHADDAAGVRVPYGLTLVRERFPEGLDEMFAYYGYEAPDVLVEALPWEGFDVAGWTISGSEPSAFVVDGEILDLGGRALEVLHVPGHTPGSIALWEASTGVLFTGDTMYADDRLSFDDQDASVTSLRRLRDLPVKVMHGGHGRSVDGDGFRSLVDATLPLSSGP
jgi:glyoxylase-like metal-dependent hydrolase (beta-lactamase superfamily II)